MESLSKSTWRQAGVRCKLTGTHTWGYFVGASHPVLTASVYSTLVAYTPTRLHYGLPIGRHKSRPVATCLFQKCNFNDNTLLETPAGRTLFLARTTIASSLPH